MLVLLVLFSVVVDEDTPHAEVRDDGRIFLLLMIVSAKSSTRGKSTNGEFPEYEVAGILQAQVACFVQTFADIAAFANLASSLVFLLLGCPHFGEAYLDVGGEL